VKSTLTIRLSDEDRKALEAIGRERRMGLSDIVRESIRRYVAIRSFQRARAMVMPYARARGILTDEDVFKLVS
jgi:predicted transcriptional regulator